jgi:WW domain-containing oxidoreductase
MAKLSTIDNDNFRNINTNFRQRFDASTNALQVLHGQDLSDKIAIVTGANLGGIGYEIARTLGRSGCSVIFACRDFAKAECAVGKVRSERPNVKCYPMHLDLASLKSVRSFASAFQVGWPNIRFFYSNKVLFLYSWRGGNGFSTRIVPKLQIRSGEATSDL